MLTNQKLWRVVLMAVSLAGCQGSDGPERAHVSGTVLYKGKPVPYGEITFSPDAEQGGSGPQGQVWIVDGKFDTSKLQKGPVPGPQIVEIAGYDGVPSESVLARGLWGLPLFDVYRVEMEIPAGHSVHEFDIPEKAKPARR